MSANVYFGFAKELQPDELFSLKRQFLPLGKVGGVPAWLNPVSLPSTDEMNCAVCNKPLAFLLQVYCTGSQSPSHAFHRSLFIFVCRDPECSRTNDASNFTIFRCQLPRNNPYYGAESALDPLVCGNVSDPFYNNATFAKLCRLCGCRATKTCAKCTHQWYCSREHQVIDWSAGGHKLHCGKMTPEEMNNLESPFSETNPFLFKEFGIEMDVEVNNKNNNNVDDEIMEHKHDGGQFESSDEDDCDGETENDMTEKLKDLKKYKHMNCEVSMKDLEAIEEKDDVLYKAFYRSVMANPTQILRYEKGGQPLLATDYSPRPHQKLSIKSARQLDAILSKTTESRLVPSCMLCGAPRQFEMQLMPHFLSLMEVDQLGKSIDWATLMVFTCSRDCVISDEGYAREFAFKQDFVEDESQDDEIQQRKKKQK